MYIPAALLWARVHARWILPPAPTPQQRQHQALVAAILVLQPALLLVDHAHFQYNGIGLGLTLAAAAAAVAGGWNLTGSVLYCCALNHKQMALFYAPAFFAYLLGQCLKEKTVPKRVWRIGQLAAAVLGTFAICWAPYLHSAESVVQVSVEYFQLHNL